MVRLKRYMLCFLLFLLVFAFNMVLKAESDITDSGGDDQLRWSGYFENQLFTQLLPDNSDLLLLDYNKLRLDMAFKVSENLTFNGDIIFRTYHGTTNINVLDFVPEKLRQQIPPEMTSEFNISFEDNYYINDAYITIYLNRISIRIGKQQLPWGTGYTWNPTDNFNRKDQLDPTYEKEGVNAVKIEVPLGLDGFITAIASNRDGVDNPNYAFKIKKNILGFDISASYQFFKEPNTDMNDFLPVIQKRQIFGFDFTGQIFDIGIWGEGTYNWPDQNNFYNKNYGEYLLGADYTFNGGLYMMMEYLHRDRGIDNPDNYDVGEYLRLLFGEVTNIGSDYLSIGATYPLTDLISFQLFSIVNLKDSSWVMVPWLVWDAGENFEISVAGNIFLGNTSTEYGEYPGGGMVRFRIYF
jgi:hypothetical protein